MTAWRQAIELSIGDEEVARLVTITRSRTEPASRVERARMLLAYREVPSFFAVAQALGVHHQTVERCVERALSYGPMAALDDRPRSGKEPTITAEAKAWLVSLACRKAKELAYPHELWTTRLLARHAREHGPVEGHGCLAKLVQGTVCKILNEAVRNHLNGGDWKLVGEFTEVERQTLGRPKLAEALKACRVRGATLIIADARGVGEWKAGSVAQLLTRL
jgi:transposase